jgi:hypothetical protein
VASTLEKEVIDIKLFVPRYLAMIIMNKTSCAVPTRILRAYFLFLLKLTYSLLNLNISLSFVSRLSDGDLFSPVDTYPYEGREYATQLLV